MNRREFLKILGLTGVALAVPPVFTSASAVEIVERAYPEEKWKYIVERSFEGPLAHSATTVGLKVTYRGKQYGSYVVLSDAFAADKNQIVLAKKALRESMRKAMRTIR